MNGKRSLAAPVADTCLSGGNAAAAAFKKLGAEKSMRSHLTCCAIAGKSPAKRRLLQIGLKEPYYEQPYRAMA